MADPKVIKLLLKSYLATIRNSVDSNTWRNFYAINDGKEEDVLKDGNLSCAYFTSSITTIFGLTESIHMTVSSTVEDLVKQGWVKIPKPRVGAVIVWEGQYFPGEGTFTHIGFYTGSERAISTSLTHHTPIEHDWLFRDSKSRQPEGIYWHPKLSDSTQVSP